MQSTALAACVVEKLDQLAAFVEIERDYAELKRCFDVFQVLHGRVFLSGRGPSGAEEQSSYPAFDKDLHEVLSSRSQKIADSYLQIVGDLGGLRRVHNAERIMAFLLSIKATHLLLRAIPSEEHKDIVRSAERAWKALSHAHQYTYKVMDISLGMKRIHDIGKNPAPVAVSWCFMWAWEKFFAEGRILCPIAKPVAAQQRIQDPRNFF